MNIRPRQPAINFPRATLSGTGTVGSGGAPPNPLTSLTLTWTAPTGYTDGSAPDVSGYNIYLGTSEASLNQVTQVGPGILTYTFENLPPGVYYAAMTVVNTLGQESDLSEYVTKTIT